MFTVTPAAAPAADKEEALNALWAFVEGIGLDPARIVEAYSSHEAFSLGLAVGMTRQSLSRALPLSAAQIFGATIPPNP